MVTKLLKLIGCDYGKVSTPTVFFDLPAREKKKVIKKAIHLANKDQLSLINKVIKKRKLKK